MLIANRSYETIVMTGLITIIFVVIYLILSL